MGRALYLNLLKRCTDLLAALIALALLSPVLLGLTLACLVMQGRPVFFRQTRVGEGCAHFRVFKFRTMRNNNLGAGTVQGQQDLQQARAAYVTTSQGDPRITPLGRFLRKTHLDELPQLFNVLAGDMSLVGPRPDVPAQEADYIPKHWALRNSVKPGITGWAQIHSANIHSVVRRTAYDVFYIRHAGFCMDLLILLKTALKVVKADSY